MKYEKVTGWVYYC